MPQPARSGKLWFCLLWVLALLSGCANIPSLPKAPVEDLTPQREARQRDAIQQFEAKRDEAAFAAATNRWQQGDTDACLTMLDELLKRNPAHRPARLLLADLYLFEERPLDAVATLESALVHHPDDAEFQRALALALDVAGRAEQAAVHHQRADELAQAQRTPLSTSSVSARTEPCDLPAVQPSDPQFTAPATALSDASSSRRGDSAQSPATTRQVATISHSTVIPQSISPAAARLLGQAQVSLRANQPAAALDQLKQAVGADPYNPQIPLSAAIELLRHGHPSLVVDLLEPSLQSFPTSARLHQTLGLAYYRLANYPAACRCLEQALSLDNSNALSYFLLGSSLNKLGQVEAARRNLQHAAQLDPQLVTRR